jgi:hypothetical protein
VREGLLWADPNTCFRRSQLAVDVDDAEALILGLDQHVVLLVETARYLYKARPDGNLCVACSTCMASLQE